MSFLSKDTVEEVILQESERIGSWEQEVVPLLPKDLEEQAWRFRSHEPKRRKSTPGVRSLASYFSVCAHCQIFSSYRSMGSDNGNSRYGGYELARTFQ